MKGMKHERKNGWRREKHGGMKFDQNNIMNNIDGKREREKKRKKGVNGKSSN